MMRTSVPHVLQSRRAPTREELDGIPWLQKLQPIHRQMAEQAIVVGEARAGDYICRVGRPVSYWLGVVDGLLKMVNDRADGGSITYVGVAAGGWFGEGTALKKEPYRYNIQALRRSTMAALPLRTFDELLDASIEFNRVIMMQLNERVGQFIMSREVDRLTNPEARVARTLVALISPVLSSHGDNSLRLTQQELANLVGLSRQRVNEALAWLGQQGLISIEYGGLRILDLAALRKV